MADEADERRATAGMPPDLFKRLFIFDRALANVRTSCRGPIRAVVNHPGGVSFRFARMRSETPAALGELLASLEAILDLPGEDEEF